MDNARLCGPKGAAALDGRHDGVLWKAVGDLYVMGAEPDSSEVTYQEMLEFLESQQPLLDETLGILADIEVDDEGLTARDVAYERICELAGSLYRSVPDRMTEDICGSEATAAR